MKFLVEIEDEVLKVMKYRTTRDYPFSQRPHITTILKFLLGEIVKDYTYWDDIKVKRLPEIYE